MCVSRAQLLQSTRAKLRSPHGFRNHYSRWPERVQSSSYSQATRTRSVVSATQFSIVTMFSVTSHVRKTVSIALYGQNGGQITLFLAFAVVFGAALLSLSHGGPQDVKWSQVKGVVQETG